MWDVVVSRGAPIYLGGYSIKALELDMAWMEPWGLGPAGWRVLSHHCEQMEPRMCNGYPT